MNVKKQLNGLAHGVMFAALAVFIAFTGANSARSQATGGDAANALAVIQKLASLRSLSPDRVRKELRARVTLRQAMWTTDRGPAWGLNYQLSGDFGALQPGGFDIRPEPPFDRTNQAADIILRFTIDGKKACISPDDLQVAFADKLTEPKFPERPYEFRDCQHHDCTATRSAPAHFILTKSPNQSVVFGYYTNNCLDEVVLTEAATTAPRDRERKTFEFITPAMNVDDAKGALSNRGFSCDPKVIDGPRSGDDAFACEVALPANDDGLKSQSVEIWRGADGKSITGVLIAKWVQPLKEATPRGN